jgi:CheY-like chemotaxis protein
MHRILIVTTGRRELAEFAQSLTEQPDIQVAWAENGHVAVADVMRHWPLAVIIDDNLLDMTGFDLVRRLLPINALINTAIISDLPPEVFHEAGEGLGILAQLPPNPTKSEALAFLARLKRMAALSAAKSQT